MCSSDLKDALKKIFTELEFRTLGQRLLGEHLPVLSKKGSAEKRQPEAVQTDLFGNRLTVAVDEKVTTPEAPDSFLAPATLQNISTTAHRYTAVSEQAALRKLIHELEGQNEICFDTETTHIDANTAELVGLSFSWLAHEGWYVTCPPKREAALQLLELFVPLFRDPAKTWIGHNQIGRAHV